MSDTASSVLVPNRPTDLGRSLGSQVARLCDNAEQIIRERFPNMRPRCGTCAFRAGTIPNGCEETLADAIKCVAEKDRLFLCHESPKGEEKQPCAGYMTLIQTTADMPSVEVPWEYADWDLDSEVHGEAHE